MAERKITIDEMTRIEGHANLIIEIDGEQVINLKFMIYEGSRYFESLLSGKSYRDIPQLAGRICGICSVAHMIASVRAVEKALNIDPGEKVHNIRKLMLYVSHIQSHILHLYFLVLPDYLNIGSTFEIGVKNQKLIKTAFKIKETLNYLTALLGGRAVHPPAIVPGGHTKRITRNMLSNYNKKMREIYPLIVETAELFLSLEYPNFEKQCEQLSLIGNNIPLYEGKIGCRGGTTLKPEMLELHLKEFDATHSSAKRYLFDGEDFMVGALSRLCINHGLRDEAREIAEMYGYDFPSRKIAWINAAQAIENVHFALQAIDLSDVIAEYEPDIIKHGEKSGDGVSVIEAPRGLLLHHYKFKNSKVKQVRIITPTAMNTENIERAIRKVVMQIIGKSDNYIKKVVEKIVRAYDPCISCAVHVTHI